MSNFTTKAFQSAFETAKSITFNPLWANGTGYFNHAVDGQNAPTLAEGEMVSTTSLNNRKIVIVGTRFGNVVVFQRYTDGENNVIVYNIPTEVNHFFNGLLPGGSIDEQVVMVLLGNDRGFNSTNIGEHFKKWLPVLAK